MSIRDERRAQRQLEEMAEAAMRAEIGRHMRFLDIKSIPWPSDDPNDPPPTDDEIWEIVG